MAESIQTSEKTIRLPSLELPLFLVVTRMENRGFSEVIIMLTK